MVSKRRTGALLAGSLAMAQQADTGLRATTVQVKDIQMDRIAPDPEQPRRIIDAEAMDSLTRSLAQDGLLQPILVKADSRTAGHYVIVAGERRWRAAQQLDWTHIPAILYDGDPDVAQLVENLQRADLSPVEEARGLQRLIGLKGWSQAQAGAALGMSQAAVANTLAILRLPETILNSHSTSNGTVSKAVLQELARIDDPALLERLRQRMESHGLTVREIRVMRTGPATPEKARREAEDMPAIPAPRPLPLKSLDRLVERFRSASPAQRRKADYRQRLLDLRSEIDRLLEDGP